jgi:peptidyl-tRNA hydrolase, PTH1 family
MFRRKPPEPALPVEKLVIGLGNPGPEYARTRHNVGFDLVEKLAAENGIKLNQSKNKALFGIGKVNGTQVAIIKPLTFMNLSGQAVAAFLRAYNLKSEDLIVIADDLDLPTAKLRFRAKGSAGGHNGHRSIIALIGTDEYARLKVGISKVDKAETKDYVLEKFTPEERVDIEQAYRKAIKAVEVWLESGPAAASEFVGN